VYDVNVGCPVDAIIDAEFISMNLGTNNINATHPLVNDPDPAGHITTN